MSKKSAASRAKARHANSKAGRRALSGQRPVGRAALSRGGAGVYWLGPLLSVAGYADEGREFVVGIQQQGVPVQALHLGPVTPGLLEDLGATYPKKAALLAKALGARPSPSRLTVIHNPGGVMGTDPDADATVARMMFETDRIPGEWVASLNEFAEVWVPTQFNVDTFLDAGVQVPVVQVPEGVDGTVYHPDHPKLAIPGVRGTVFLSVFEWYDRKAPGVLLGAWADAFGPHDDVTLLLRVYPVGGHEVIDNQRAADGLIERQLEALGTTRSATAPIVALGKHLPPGAMPRLYCTADVYVSPTRGEAWGRPFTEAQACGRPTIATNWSAPPEILRRDANLFIEVEELITVPRSFEIKTFHGHRWASPSREHLAELLRWCHEHRDLLPEMGRRGRMDMLSRWRWDQAAARAKERIVQLGGTSRSRTRAAVRPPRDPFVRWQGDVARLHSLAKVNRELASRIARSGRFAVQAVTFEPQSLARAARLPFDTVGALGAKGRPAVEVRHSWPPMFDQTPWPLVVVQPWEFGVAPRAWVEHADEVQEWWTPSRYSRECFLRAGIPEESVAVVPNGVDTTVFAPRERSERSGPVRFLYVGGTIQRKGFDLVLQAYCAAFSRKDDVVLVAKPFLSNAQYAGMNLDEALRRAAADEANPRIEVVEDDLDEQGLADLYRSCDVLLAPYRGEAFCLPVLEAMACGVPAVVTGAGGAMDFASSSTSWLVPCRETPMALGEEFVPAAGRFTWFEPDLGALVELLRAVVGDEAGRQERSTAGIQQAAAFTWEKAARTAEERLARLAGESVVDEERDLVGANGPR
ncbi:glycosyltransferase [Aciditerrimonas ferrireducens]|uniref:glycosyltransferase n=1 Tax=Aciditerrimonas ferrireducens TaxID=667306 RepID=UPI002004E427|nr:glycosyltransferase [Aciditerrimonas ferrireducens]MCK4177611.1 glycosyltransferase [Aciditerrimonas ferrireducens]